MYQYSKQRNAIFYTCFTIVGMQRTHWLKVVLNTVVLCWEMKVPLTGISLKSYKKLCIRPLYVGILHGPQHQAAWASWPVA